MDRREAWCLQSPRWYVRRMPDDVPRSLRAWFIAHFAACLCAAAPLFLAPQGMLRMLGWITVDPVSTRLVAAALFALGVRSFVARNESLERCRELLALEVIWSGAALAGLVVSALQGAAPLTWAFAGIFAILTSVWIAYAVRLRAR